MASDVIQAIKAAPLSPIICRIALIIADVEGDARALEFVESCLLDRADDQSPAAEPVEPRPAGQAFNGKA